MPVPLPVLLAAAERVVSDERTQAVGKAVWKKGVELWSNRSASEAAYTPLPEADEPKKSGKIAGALKQRFAKRRLRKGQEGNLLKFSYTDEHGITSNRLVGNWSSDGNEISGYCLNRREICAFAIDRVDDWQEIEV